MSWWKDLQVKVRLTKPSAEIMEYFQEYMEGHKGSSEVTDEDFELMFETFWDMYGESFTTYEIEDLK